jgi:hypothetical protein
MCGVTRPCVLLSMLLLVRASLAPMQLLKYGECVYVGVSTPKVDSFSYLGERRYPASVL